MTRNYRHRRDTDVGATTLAPCLRPGGGDDWWGEPHTSCTGSHSVAGWGEVHCDCWCHDRDREQPEQAS